MQYKFIYNKIITLDIAEKKIYFKENKIRQEAHKYPML